MSDVEQMIDAPTPHARIWLTPPCCGNYEHGEVTWCQDAVNECGNCGAQPTEYVPAARLSTLTAALAAVTAERDALREALAKTAQPHFWWDTDDSENGCDDITTILDNYDIGEVVEVSCARNLPNQWAVGYVTESGGFRGQTFATEAEAVEFAAARAALTANHSAPVVEE